jgi:multiple sugar transport system permease protein
MTPSLIGTRRRLGGSAEARRNLMAGIIFASPWIIGFCVFTLYPLASSLYYSFTNYDILQPPRWVGLDNYKTILTGDNLIGVSLFNTFYFMSFVVPLSTVLGIAMAMLLNMKVRGMAIYRTIYYLPTIVPAVASTLLWLWLLDPTHGVVNLVLAYLGLPTVGWFSDPNWSKPALILVNLWGVGQAVVIYLAGLQGVPQHLYEAAAIDGAGWWNKTWHVTLPMLSPVIFFNVVIGVIGAFTYFTQAFVVGNAIGSATGGGQAAVGAPLNSTLFYALYLWQNAFQYLQMGYASAMAWVLVLIVLICSLIIFRSSGRWVYYEGGTRR